MAFGNRLKEVRANLGLKQPEMANLLGIATSTYQYYERGERDTPFTIIKKITTKGVDPLWLITGEGEPGIEILKSRNVSDESKQFLKKDEFDQKVLTQRINDELVVLKKIKPAALIEVREFIKFKIDMHDRRKEQRRKCDCGYTGEERRSGLERRNAIG